MKVKSWLTLIERRCFFKLVEVSDHMEGVFNLLVYSSLVLCMFFFLLFFGEGGDHCAGAKVWVGALLFLIIFSDGCSLSSFLNGYSVKVKIKRKVKMTQD